MADRIAQTKSEVKESISNDWGFYIEAIGESED
jgi:hypothetical protein